MTNSVEIYNDEPRCGTFLISQGFQRRHNHILRLIDDNKEIFEDLGQLGVRKVKTKGRPVIEYLLNNDQVLFLLSLIRGIGNIVKFKAHAIKASNIISILKALKDFDFGESNQKYVYCAQDESGNIKIGISNNPEERVKQLNIGNSQKLTLIFIKEANKPNYEEETIIHKHCEKYNIRSEWFTNEDIKVLENDKTYKKFSADDLQGK